MAERDDRALVDAAYEERARLAEAGTRDAVLRTIDALDRGELRVATPPAEEGGEWIVAAWVGRAVLLYFGVQQLAPIEVGPFEYHDKIPLKRDYAGRGVRVVPPATVRHGAFIEQGAVLMPSYVNIGAWVGEHRGYVPPRSVVIPGAVPKDFPAGTYQVPVALIIGERKPSTDRKTSLNQALRDFGVTV